MNCPHCETELTPHDTEYGVKKGALHCYGCGCCFREDLTAREGVPMCELAQAKQTSPSVTPEPAPDIEDPVASRPRRSRR